MLNCYPTLEADLLRSLYLLYQALRVESGSELVFCPNVALPPYRVFESLWTNWLRLAALLLDLDVS